VHVHEQVCGSKKTCSSPLSLRTAPPSS
jgi:hypothetical protein